MQDKQLMRHHVGKRLSEMAVFNGVVYLAGQVPENNPDADISAQTREVLGHVDRLLAEAGSSKHRILMCQIFLRDIADIEAMNAVWDSWVSEGNAPPRATVQSALADPRWRIEIVVTAARGQAE